MSSNILKDEKVPNFEELLSDLSDPDVEKFSQYLEREKYVQGETIFYQNDPSNSLFVVQAGRVEISKISGDEGDEYSTLVELNEGNIFGEISFLTESDRSANAVAATHVVLYRMSRKNFDTIVDEHPKLGCKVYHAILRVLAYRLKRTDSKLVQLSDTGNPSNPID